MENLSLFLDWCRAFDARLPTGSKSDLRWGSEGPNPSGHYTVELSNGRMATLSYWQSGSADWTLLGPGGRATMDRMDDLEPDHFDASFTTFQDWLTRIEKN